MPIRDRSSQRKQQALPAGLHGRPASNSCAIILLFAENYTPVLAKHSRHFLLEDALSIGVDRMQRNFDPMRLQVERWRARQLSTEAATFPIYKAFIEGDLDVPKRLARRVHDLYFNRSIGSLSRERFGASQTRLPQHSRASIQSRNSVLRPSWEASLRRSIRQLPPLRESRRRFCPSR